MKINQIGFLGLGFIGGSIAKSIKNLHSDIEIIAFDIDTESLQLAKKEGTIERALDNWETGFSDCDILFLCAPVSHNSMNLNDLGKYLKKSCILTDVGSVKNDIHKTIESLGLSDYFIGGHPMAGSEKTGYGNSSDHLIENVFYILTPSTKDVEKINTFKEFIRSLGALPLEMDYKTHDYVTASISHLPHIIAAGIVNHVETQDTPDGLMKMVAAGGFKDITRIASSSPVMWEQICMSNRTYLVDALEKFIDYLNHIKDTIIHENSKDIYDFFCHAQEYRNSFSSISAGPIKKVNELYCDVTDTVGQIATLSGILAKHYISIKNIGILNNREFEEGVLRIEFYDEKATLESLQLLKSYEYVVYQRN